MQKQLGEGLSTYRPIRLPVQNDSHDGVEDCPLPAQSGFHAHKLRSNHVPRCPKTKISRDIQQNPECLQPLCQAQHLGMAEVEQVEVTDDLPACAHQHKKTECKVYHFMRSVLVGNEQITMWKKKPRHSL